MLQPPAIGEHISPRVVAAGRYIQYAPDTMVKHRVARELEHPLVQILNLRVRDFVRPSAELHRRPDAPPFLLPIEEKSHVRKRCHQAQSGGKLCSERSGASRFVVILDKTTETPRIGIARSQQAANLPHAVGAVQTVQEPLVVRELKPFVENSTLEIPIDFGEIDWLRNH